MIYAHDRPGMFAPLVHATVGQHVEVTRNQQPTLRYVIRQYFPSWKASDTSILNPADHEELVLLTCTTYNPNDPRMVAVAEPAG